MAEETTSTKYEEVADGIREEIVSGDLSGDAKLPPRRSFQKQYGVSSITVQKAFDLLLEEGFVESRGKTGTYLTPNPPHSHRIAIVYHHPRKRIHRSKFYSRILQQAAQVTQETPYSFEEYYDVEADNPRGRKETARLFDDMRSHRLGGVLVGHNVPNFHFPEWPVWQETGMPRVVVQSSPIHPRFPAIYPDMQGFHSLALDVLLDRGIRRIGVVGRSNMAGESESLLDVELSERGLSIPTYLRLPINPNSCSGVKNAVHMMMRLPDRPGGLLVTDDNLLDHTGAGILAAGLSVPEDIVVVSEANFPVPNETIIPAVHVGFDIHKMVLKCLERMGQQRESGAFTNDKIVIEPEVADSSPISHQEDFIHAAEEIYAY